MSDPMAELVARIRRDWDRMNKTERAEADRLYKDLGHLEYLHVMAGRVVCYGCKKERVPHGGERGSMVLDGTRWCCDDCTADNRAAIAAECMHRRRWG